MIDINPALKSDHKNHLATLQGKVIKLCADENEIDFQLKNHENERSTT